jgi:hypothetical protein
MYLEFDCKDKQSFKNNHFTLPTMQYYFSIFAPYYTI